MEWRLFTGRMGSLLLGTPDLHWHEPNLKVGSNPASHSLKPATLFLADTLQEKVMSFLISH